MPLKRIKNFICLYTQKKEGHKKKNLRRKGKEKKARISLAEKNKYPSGEKSLLTKKENKNDAELSSVG